jgi:hypothetical protein
MEARCHRNCRNILRDGIEALQRIGAHEKIYLADRQQDAVVHVGAARQDRHVESVLLVCAVGERLIEAAVFGLGEPIGGKADLIQLLGLYPRN